LLASPRTCVSTEHVLCKARTHRSARGDISFAPQAGGVASSPKAAWKITAERLGHVLRTKGGGRSRKNENGVVSTSLDTGPVSVVGIAVSSPPSAAYQFDELSARGCGDAAILLAEPAELLIEQLGWLNDNDAARVQLGHARHKNRCLNLGLGTEQRDGVRRRGGFGVWFTLDEANLTPGKRASENTTCASRCQSILGDQDTIKRPSI